VGAEIANYLKTNNMSKCPNCGSTLTCGCQKRKLADGRVGCSKCVGTATAKITGKSQETKKE
jgi:protein-arginine kinase activator protein McsA